MLSEEESENTYLRDPRSKNIEGFIAALQVFSKYTKKGMQESYVFGAEHDILYIWVEGSQVSDEDATLLSSLGWHIDSEGGNWAYFT